MGQRGDAAFHSLERCGVPKAMQTGMLLAIRGKTAEGTCTLLILWLFRMQNCSLFNSKR